MCMQRLQVIFNVIFTLEAMAKILSLGSFMRYIVQPINTFDFSLVVVSDLLMILGLIGVKLPNVSFFRKPSSVESMSTELSTMPVAGWGL